MTAPYRNFQARDLNMRYLLCSSDGLTRADRGRLVKLSRCQRHNLFVAAVERAVYKLARKWRCKLNGSRIGVL